MHSSPGNLPFYGMEKQECKFNDVNRLCVYTAKEASNLGVFIFLRFYLFIQERERERGRDIGRERSRLHADSLMWDSILGLQDHALG